jgi:thiosulfate/3-mercaptopyruvate sulfurtransferase
MSLISVDELRDRLGEPGLVVVDARWVLGKPGAGRQAYLAGHLPGAVFLDLDTDLADESIPPEVGGRHPLPSPSEFARRMGAVGIGDGSFVVAYDDSGGWVAARLWWMLEHVGHPGAAVLDGGWGAWLAAGMPIDVDLPPVAPSRLSVRGPAATGGGPAATGGGPAATGAWPGVITREELRARLGSVVLLDARAGERYRGEVEPIDPAAGHIPTAVSAPTAGNLGPDGRFLSPEALRGRFVTLGVGERDGRPVVTSCGSGTSACHHSLAMRAAGLPDPLLYVGSFSQWSRSPGYPIATGSEPGEAPDDSP